ncbi:hypothetical protein RugamoR64_28990 [Duganella rhizosphaerae]|uniref:PEP-CTERM sorting domain-containing protein n=1 Tax=Duganella rhizosphaerae TaxID=2885763 RepID=UPI0030EABB2D
MPSPSNILPNKKITGTALLALTSLAAHADVIRVDGLNQSLGGLWFGIGTPPLISIAVDVDHNGTTDFSLANNAALYGQSWAVIGGIGSTAFSLPAYDRSVTAGAQGVAASSVAAGTLIGPSLAMSKTVTLDLTTNRQVGSIIGPCNNTGKGSPGGGQQCGQLSVLASTITNNNIGNNLLVPFQFSSGQQTQYGWIDVTILDNPSVKVATSPYIVTFNGYGYDNTGAAVAAGAAAFTSPVPEPSSLLMLASGLAGIAAYRRKGRGRRTDAALPA